MIKVPEKTVARISLYRRLLREYVKNLTNTSIYSHQLAEMSGSTPAQVRRDLMYIGYKGVSRKGYVVTDLLTHIDTFFSYKEEEISNVVLIGVGNIGKALLSYFSTNVCRINILAAFDSKKCGQIENYRLCYDIKDLEQFIKEHKIKTVILALPEDKTQEMADKVVSYGVKGILNFADVKLNLPKEVFVESVDITMHLEKVLFFAQ